jgi:hypothetical protein
MHIERASDRLMATSHDLPNTPESRLWKTTIKECSSEKFGLRKFPTPWGSRGR